MNPQQNDYPANPMHSGTPVSTGGVSPDAMTFAGHAPVASCDFVAAVYQESVDQVAVAIKKLVDAGLGAAAASETAVKLWGACCRRN